MVRLEVDKYEEVVVVLELLEVVKENVYNAVFGPPGAPRQNPEEKVRQQMLVSPLVV